MATLAAAATGNWTAAGTWGLVDSTSFLNSEAVSTAISTTNLDSSTFTPGAITVDAVAVKLAARAASPSGTFTVTLRNSTDAVDVTSVTVNVSDLPTCSTASTGIEGGWQLLKFSASQLLTAGKAYLVRVVCSATGSQVTLYRDSTANNWSRMLRTTTTQAPVAGDDVVIGKEYTGAGAANALTVTMNETATTDYGSNTASSVTPALAITNGGTLTYGASAATNYYLKLSGRAIVYNGGTFNIGTVATAIPRDSTAVLEFDPAADGGHGLIARNGSNLVIQGLSRTVSKNIFYCKLNTDEAIDSTILGVDTDTGWLSGDQIVVATTTQTAGQSEIGTLNGNAGATSLTVNGFGGVGGGIAYAHSGTSPTQAEIINLTRNVKIRSATSTLMAFVSIKPTATVDIDWAEFIYIGVSATDQRGIDIETTTGSFNMQYSSVHDTEHYGVYCTGTSLDNVTFSNNVLWNLNSTASTGEYGIRVGPTSGASISISNNFLIKMSGSGSYGALISDVGITFNANTFISCSGSYAIVYGEAIGVNLNSFNNNVIHGNSTTYGIYLSVLSGTISNCVLWRNANSLGCLYIGGPLNDLVIDATVLFGNSTGVAFQNPSDVTIKGMISNGDTTFASATGITPYGNIVLDNCDFSSVSGIKTAHTQDIIVGSAYDLHLIARNCKFGAATEISSQTNLWGDACISSQKHDQTAGEWRTWMRYGTLRNDTAIFNTASPSMRMTPNNANSKLESANQFRGIQVAVASGGTVTINVYTRKSTAGDGAAYNGAQPRLIQKANPAMGFNSDVVIDTHTAAAGTWEQLTGTTGAAGDDGVLEFVVDCDGTAGWVSVDDWSAS